MITVEGLTKTYGGFRAVDDVSFVAQPGRVTGFLGPNGSGKTTTIRKKELAESNAVGENQAAFDEITTIRQKELAEPNADGKNQAGRSARSV